VLATFILLLALAYLGALAFIPASLTLVVLANSASRVDHPLPTGLALLGWATAVGAPAAVGVALRRPNLVPLAVAAAWAVAGTFLASYPGVVPYLWCAVLAVGVIAWGLHDRRAERINLGIAGFALTVLLFYFSDAMDKLGRSASLITLTPLEIR
jgi:hypothetical protein